MIDFLSDGPTLRGLLAVLSIGAERLAAERGAAHGEALESAVLAALECLVTALDMDVDAVARLREDAAGPGSAADSAHAFRRTLDAVLLRDVAQCAAVLGYVQYRFNPALPLASLRVLSVLSDRVDRLVDLLPPESRRSLTEGAASCLELAALPGGASPRGTRRRRRRRGKWRRLARWSRRPPRHPRASSAVRRAPPPGIRRVARLGIVPAGSLLRV